MSQLVTVSGFVSVKAEVGVDGGNLERLSNFKARMEMLTTL